MLRRCLGLFPALLLLHTAFAQLQSPEQFLGYRIGTRFTPHWKIVSYFRSVAAAVPGMGTLKEYGETNDPRPLLAVFVSSPAHIARLETIRVNNLRLADDPGQPLPAGAPVLVWLSYNVHGNEASSSE